MLRLFLGAPLSASRIVLLFLLFGCSAEPTASAVDDDFRWDHSVRVTQPANGATVSETFTIEWETGEDVSTVQLEVAGAPYGDPVLTGTRNRGVFRLTLDQGRHRLNVEGLDDTGQVVSAHDLTVRVAATETPWVSIVSPRDRSVAFNPVTFTVSAADNADQIVLEADGWTLGEVGPNGTLTHTFDGTDFPRVITTTAFENGEAIATDTISLTVTDAQSPGTSSYNAAVLDRIATYPTDGSYGYYWPRGGGWAGTTQDIWYLDTRVATGDAYQRSYCVGLTWEVFMRAYQTLQDQDGMPETLAGLDVSELLDFRTDWYVRDLFGSGVVEAVERAGIGARVTNLGEAQPGDFVQFWRNSGSGHSVIFDGLNYDDAGTLQGIRYWSTQGSTDGIGYRVENFGPESHQLDPASFFVARVFAPSEWPSL